MVLNDFLFTFFRTVWGFLAKIRNGRSGSRRLWKMYKMYRILSKNSFLALKILIFNKLKLIPFLELIHWIIFSLWVSCGNEVNWSRYFLFKVSKMNSYLMTVFKASPKNFHFKVIKAKNDLHITMIHIICLINIILRILWKIIYLRWNTVRVVQYTRYYDSKKGSKKGSKKVFNSIHFIKKLLYQSNIVFVGLKKIRLLLDSNSHYS